jgi:hypothetical protein
MVIQEPGDAFQSDSALLTPLEAEGGSEVDKAIRIRTAAEGIVQGEALAELRPKGAHRRPEVGVIEYVIHFSAEVKGIRLGGRRRWWGKLAVGPRFGRRRGRCGRRLAEVKAFIQAQPGIDEAGSFAVVDRNDGLPRLRIGIEGAKGRLVYGSCWAGGGSEAGTVVKLAVPVEVCAGRDIEGLAVKVGC